MRYAHGQGRPTYAPRKVKRSCRVLDSNWPVEIAAHRSLTVVELFLYIFRFITKTSSVPGGTYLLLCPCRDGPWNGDKHTTVSCMRTFAAAMRFFSSKFVCRVAGLDDCGSVALLFERRGSFFVHLRVHEAGRFLHAFDAFQRVPTATCGRAAPPVVIASGTAAPASAAGPPGRHCRPASC